MTKSNVRVIIPSNQERVIRVSFEKALKILGLTRDYTEEELRKAYRQLMNKYHPDRYVNKSDFEKQMAENKSKEINEAREYLKKHLENKANNSYDRSSSSNPYERSNATKSHNSGEKEKYNKLDRLKKNILNKIEIQKKEVASINDNNDKLLREIKGVLLYTFHNYEVSVLYVMTISDLKKIYSMLMDKVQEILDFYSKEYCKKYNIVLDEKTKSNLDCYSLKMLQKQLEELKNKNESFIRRIQEEFDKYVYYKGFDDIQIILLKLQKAIVSEYKNKNTDIEELLISKFNAKVLQAFEDYYKRLAILNSMKSKDQNSKDRKIKKNTYKIKKYLQN